MFAFGPFQFDPTERLLTRDGVKVRLAPKAGSQVDDPSFDIVVDDCLAHFHHTVHSLIGEANLQQKRKKAASNRVWLSAKGKKRAKSKTDVRRREARLQ